CHAGGIAGLRPSLLPSLTPSLSPSLNCVSLPTDRIYIHQNFVDCDARCYVACCRFRRQASHGQQAPGGILHAHRRRHSVMGRCPPAGTGRNSRTVPHTFSCPFVHHNGGHHFKRSIQRQHIICQPSGKHARTHVVQRERSLNRQRP